MSRLTLIVAAISGFLAVALGAFGAHGLETMLTVELLSTYETGVEYHMSHSLALFGVGVLLQRFPRNQTLMFASYGFMSGVVLFSGSLYVLSITGISWLGAITPLGGIGFLVGWAALAKFAWQHGNTQSS